MSRLAADTFVVARKSQQNSASYERQNNREVQFVNASYRKNYVKNIEADELPCSLSEMESVVLDYHATATTTSFGSLMGYLEVKKIITDKAGKFIGKANILLTVMKLLSTYAALDSEITLDGKMLTRTKTLQAGETKNLSAKVKIDVGKWQMMNCIRPALNYSGFDFSLPGSGALSNVRVDWNLVEGGTSDSYFGRVWNTMSNLDVNLKPQGNFDTDSAIVFLDKGEDKTDKKHYTYTDDNGVAKIQAVGMPQKTDLSKKPVRSVMKQMSVDLDIQVKTMRLKNTVAVAGTAGDMAGNVIAFLTGDNVGGSVGTAAETIYRSNLGSSKTVSFPVKDWVICDGGWSGTITYHRIYDETYRGETGKGVRVDGTLHVSRDHREYLAKINVQQVAGQNELDANVKITAIDEYAEYKRTVYNDSCVYEKNGKNRLKTTIRQGYRTTYGSGGGKADMFQIYISGTNANVQFFLPNIQGTFFERNKSTFSNFCGENKPENFSKSTPAKIDGIRYSHDIPIDPENPSHLKGKAVIPGGKGYKLIFTWDLSRCQ